MSASGKKNKVRAGVGANLLFCALALAVLGLGARLFQLVKYERQRGQRLGRVQQRKATPIPGRPGNIYAVAGRRTVLVASSRQVPSCFADPFLLDDSRDLLDTAIAAGKALGLDPVRVHEKLLLRSGRRFVWLKRGLSDAEARAVRALRSPAVAIQHEWRRTYPNGSLAGTSVGFRRVDGVGGSGLELALHSDLTGKDGRQVVLTDAARRGIRPLVAESVLPEDGHHVLLSLDLVIQGYLQEAVAHSVREYGAPWGTGIVIGPATGRVLAMCSVPTFNPNQYSKAVASTRTNRAISCPYEPGSVVKPLFAAAAVDQGEVAWTNKIFCEDGVYRAHRGGKISDHGKAYGWLTVTDVVVDSSNIGMAKLGEMLGNRALCEIARRFGFGQRTGIELPAESPGQLRPLAKWDGYSLRRIPFGQEVSTTTLQLAVAFGAVANGGVLLRPRIVDRVVDAWGRTVRQGRAVVVRRVLSPSVAAQAVDVMRQVVERGTGRSSRMQQWTSFGKTGTAQIAGPGGYPEGAYVGSFVAGAPCANPRLICLISIYWPERSKGYYGSKVAAPSVKDVLAKTLTYLDVPPDRPSALARAEY